METPEELARDYAAEIAEASERLRFATDLAKSGIQSMTIVNGGALIALFTLLGTGRLTFDLSALWLAFGFFAIGIAAAQASYLFGYLSQNRFYLLSVHRAWTLSARIAGREQTWDDTAHRKWGDRWLAMAIIAGAASLVAFVLGAGFALASAN